MGARDKLNSASMTGIMVFAGFMGFLFDSWGAFILIATIGIALALNSGELRPWPVNSEYRYNRRLAARHFHSRN